MQVLFVKDTHYFFSAGKDKTVKYWDGDNYNLILQFDECLGEVWGIAVSSIGDFFVAAGNDKAIRLWKQNKDQVFVEEENEKRGEKKIVQEHFEEGEKEEEGEMGEACLVVKKKYENLKYGEEIMGAVDLADLMREEWVAYENELVMFSKGEGKEPTRPGQDQLGNVSIPEYVMN